MTCIQVFGEPFCCECCTDIFGTFCPLCLQQARAEQEEEFISNTLFKKIQALQKEKETLAVNYEKEEEFLTNELSRKLMQVSDIWKITDPGAFNLCQVFVAMST